MFKSLVSNTTQAATQATTQDHNSLKSRILQAISEDPFLSQKEIAEKLEENHNTVPG